MGFSLHTPASPSKWSSTRGTGGGISGSYSPRPRSPHGQEDANTPSNLRTSRTTACTRSRTTSGRPGRARARRHDRRHNCEDPACRVYSWPFIRVSPLWTPMNVAVAGNSHLDNSAIHSPAPERSAPSVTRHYGAAVARATPYIPPCDSLAPCPKSSTGSSYLQNDLDARKAKAGRVTSSPRSTVSASAPAPLLPLLAASQSPPRPISRPPPNAGHRAPSLRLRPTPRAGGIARCLAPYISDPRSLYRAHPHGPTEGLRVVPPPGVEDVAGSAGERAASPSASSSRHLQHPDTPRLRGWHHDIPAGVDDTGVVPPSSRRTCVAAPNMAEYLCARIQPAYTCRPRAEWASVSGLTASSASASAPAPLPPFGPTTRGHTPVLRPGSRSRPLRWAYSKRSASSPHFESGMDGGVKGGVYCVPAL
ncbi:hypothetical protein C8R44DRAFT_984187 [Mycena epipterygia]|nr:hypothetical protein C8R44DRAFT_984187 [Mycena epipterygia]